MILSKYEEEETEIPVCCSAESRPGPTTCIICQELILSYEPETEDSTLSLKPVVVTRCGHLFHAECINEWFLKSQGDGDYPHLKPCAYCRREMQWEDLTRIFPVNRHMLQNPDDTSYSNQRPDPAICTICDKYILSFDGDNGEDGSTQNLRPYVAAKCGHLFHTDCVNEWFSIRLLDDPKLKPCHYCGKEMIRGIDLKRVFPVCVELEE